MPVPDNQRITYLLDAYTSGHSSGPEEEELFTWISADGGHPLLEEHVRRLTADGTLPEGYAAADTERMLRNIHQRIHGTHKVIGMRRWWWAACLLVLLGAGAYYRFHEADTPVTTADVLPGGQKATLTLADGAVIELNDAGNRTIREGIRQEGGSLQYDGRQTASLNMLRTPRGGQFRLKLPDGTQVWLNAASSLKYPTAFTGKERIVEVSGEAYFEVAQNAAMPFKVKVGENTMVEVLGTHFNISAYSDEPGMQATLLNGSIRVQDIILKPGQQAVVTKEKTSIRNADLQQVVAWKDGLFSFQNKSLEEVMREISRWYDIDVVYEGKIPAIEFGGRVGRDLTLAQLLVFLEKAEVHFRIDEQRRLVVMP